MLKNKGSKIENNMYSDGKWRFLTYDLDFTIIYDYEAHVTQDEGYKYNKFESLISFNNYPSTSLFWALLKNEIFKNKFKNTYVEYTREIMTMDKIKPIIEEYIEDLTELFSLSKTRWNGNEGSKIEMIQIAKDNFRNKIVPQIQKFFELRPTITLEHMEAFLKNFE